MSIFRTIFLLLTLILIASARPVDTEESLHASRFHRLISGMRYGLEMALEITSPSQEKVVTPTRIKVYFVGLGRTGTTSLAAAMNILGYNVLHDDEGPSVADLYGAFYRHEITEDQLHEKLGERGFNCSFMYSGYHWAAKQDDVKVVLQTRDPEKWVDSWLVVADGVDIFSRRPFIWLQTIQDMMPVLIECFKDIPTGGHPEGYLDRDTLLKGYQTHLENVRQEVPPERLLEYNVKQRWGPLCEFLGVPVPDVPFPHVNDRLKMWAVVTTTRVITWIWPLFIIVPLLLVGWLTRRVVVLVQKRDKKIKTM